MEVVNELPHLTIVSPRAFRSIILLSLLILEDNGSSGFEIKLFNRLYYVPIDSPTFPFFKWPLRS